MDSTNIRVKCRFIRDLFFLFRILHFKQTWVEWISYYTLPRSKLVKPEGVGGISLLYLFFFCYFYNQKFKESATFSLIKQVIISGCRTLCTFTWRIASHLFWSMASGCFKFWSRPPTYFISSHRTVLNTKNGKLFQI